MSVHLQVDAEVASGGNVWKFRNFDLEHVFIQQ
jgi:hypothetical protein